MQDYSVEYTSIRNMGFTMIPIQNTHNVGWMRFLFVLFSLCTNADGCFTHIICRLKFNLFLENKKISKNFLMKFFMANSTVTRKILIELPKKHSFSQSVLPGVAYRHIESKRMIIPYICIYYSFVPQQVRIMWNEDNFRLHRRQIFS